MADQDDFEPNGRCWKKTRDLYLMGGDAKAIAESTELVLSRMIKVCGGSELLIPVLEGLQQFFITRREHPLWHALTNDTHTAQFEALLECLEPRARERRIDAVLMRSARAVAASLQMSLTPEAFAASVLQDVARHCCLDDARARSLGGRFDSDVQGRADAHAFHQTVLACLAPALDFLGKRFVHDPSGRTIRRRPHRATPDIYNERIA